MTTDETKPDTTTGDAASPTITTGGETKPKTRRKPIFTFLATALVVIWIAVTISAIVEARSKASGFDDLMGHMMGLLVVAVLMCLTAPPAFLFSLLGHWRNERWKVARIFSMILSAAGVALMIYGWIDHLQRGG